MDIASFISNLLTKQGELVVPGLGTFTKARVDGYYQKEQQQFYPPSHQVQFKTEYTDDNVLANMIANERQISVASAKYFIEKFVTHIKDEAEVGNATFGNMGSFSTRRGALVFSVSDLNESDELFYGLAPVKIKRNNAFKLPGAVVTPPKLVDLPPPPPEPEPIVNEVIQNIPEAEEEYIEEEEEPTRRINIWLVLALLIIVAGVTVIGLYLYKPALFDRLIKHNSVTVVTKTSHDDSLKQALQAQKDMGIVPATSSSVTNTVAPVDTFRIIEGSFKTSRKANEEAGICKKKGVAADVFKDDAIKKYRVIVGTYFNLDSANAAVPALKEKLKSDISVQTYPFKKQ